MFTIQTGQAANRQWKGVGGRDPAGLQVLLLLVQWGNWAEVPFVCARGLPHSAGELASFSPVGGGAVEDPVGCHRARAGFPRRQLTSL